MRFVYITTQINRRHRVQCELKYALLVKLDLNIFFSIAFRSRKLHDGIMTVNYIWSRRFLDAFFFSWNFDFFAILEKKSYFLPNL